MEVFFYGLFMDEHILIKKGITPFNPRFGYLNNYTLKIGDRASLIQSEGERAYGILMTVNDGELVRLYAEESVADYVREQVVVNTENNKYVVAWCYNLPRNLLTGTNRLYARSLYKLADRLNFPDAYLDRIRKYFS